MRNDAARTGANDDLFAPSPERAALAQLANGPVDERRILIKAAYGKQQGKMKIHPRSANGKLMGVVEYSEDEKRKLPAHMIVTTETHVWIEDDFELDLTDEKDAVTWGWLQHCQGDIAHSRDEAQASPDCAFFVQNDEKDTRERLTRTRLTKKALDYIYNEGSQTRLVEVCRLLGSRMESAKPLDIEEYLVSVAEKTPKRIVDAFEDKNARVKLFLFRAVDKSSVEVNPAGIYKYGEITMGISEEHAIEWLKNPENASLVTHIRAEVYPEYFQNSVPDAAFDPRHFAKKYTQPEAPAQPQAPSVPSASDFGGEEEDLTDFGGDADIDAQLSAQASAATDNAKAPVAPGAPVLTPAQKGVQTKKEREAAAKAAGNNNSAK